MTRPLSVSVERVIKADRPRLAAFAADMGNAPRWYRNIASVDWKTAPGTSPGARAAFVAQFMGRALAYTYEIREHIPGERLVMSTEDGPFPMETVYEWFDEGAGRTRMRLTNRGRPEGFKAVLMPVMSLAMRRAMTQDLAQLARVLPR
ncbi:SRPBCC family protein [Maritimibacter sp. DP1N21-5]|uniref:SRPBCC family protein n=1 Tax=Maritimibacter sp. DP1N21-5 TaxID=2836867 RepID=UPI001C44EA26|nr:SRPBCC family protein [Maritimibacter sp. DP1N21-5]MBV7409274.1 SRPBCC family protein [Maritimibacter sp. DP1N21-5]